MITVQQVIINVSMDLRGVLASTGYDQALIAGWVDRIHKDMLRTSLYSYLTRSSVTINLVPGQVAYDMGTPMRSIALVYDRTNNRNILPYSAEGLGPGEEGSAVQTDTTRPNFYIRNGAQVLYIFPVLDQADKLATLNVHFYNYVNTVGINDTLLLPDEAFDIVHAGVMSIACNYLKTIEEANRWGTMYENGKKG